MEFLFLVLISLCLCLSLHSLFSLLRKKNLPPSPPTLPFLGNLLWLLKSSKDFAQMEPVLHVLTKKYGPLITLHIGSRPAVFITSHDVAHRALVRKAAAFAGRPILETTRALFSDQRTLTTAPYGPHWRLLRRNFQTVLHPSRMHLYTEGRAWTLNALKKKLHREAESGNSVVVIDEVRHALFSLLAYTFFGEKYEEEVVRDIELALRPLVSSFIKFNVLNFVPRLGKIVFRRLWAELLAIRDNQEKVIIPLVRARLEKLKRVTEADDHSRVPCYLDTLFDLKPNGETAFTERDIVSLCTEYIAAGTDTTVAALEWAMANIVKHQDVQEKIYKEIEAASGKELDVIEEDTLKEMPYLKAVVLETLRRHPPGHFMLPRAVTENDVVFDGYNIPREAIVNVAVAELGWNPEVWEDPMEFRPERFVDGDGKVEFDLKGVKEIKMVPFGAGTRRCPAISMAFLHLEFLVANLIREFRWTSVDGEDLSFEEKQDFTVVMKYPLRACIRPRLT